IAPDGAAAMLVYQDADGGRISVYVRPSTRLDGVRGSRSDEGLALRYWFRNGYGFAVVGRADDPRTLAVQQAIPPAVSRGPEGLNLRLCNPRPRPRSTHFANAWTGGPAPPATRGAR